MNTSIRILGIAGSLRRGSYNRAALRAAAELAPKGATVETFDLDGIPPFNQDEEQNPPAKVTELKRRIREANAILLIGFANRFFVMLQWMLAFLTKRRQVRVFPRQERAAEAP